MSKSKNTPSAVTEAVETPSAQIEAELPAPAVDALRAEIDRVRAELESGAAAFDALRAELAESKAEVERVRADRDEAVHSLVMSGGGLEALQRDARAASERADAAERDRDHYQREALELRARLVSRPAGSDPALVLSALCAAVQLGAPDHVRKAALHLADRIAREVDGG